MTQLFDRVEGSLIMHAVSASGLILSSLIRWWLFEMCGFWVFSIDFAIFKIVQFNGFVIRCTISAIQNALAERLCVCNALRLGIEKEHIICIHLGVLISKFN